jgi:flagellar M-ring protein FliF
VAVLVDGKYEENKYLARSAEEMEIIKGVVKRAVGFDSERGDELEVANVPFKLHPAAPLHPLATPDLKDQLMSPMGIGVAVGVLAVLGALVFLLVRRKAPKALPQAAAAPVEPAAEPIPHEVKQQMTAAAEKIILAADPRKEQLAQIAKDYHDATVRILRMWLQEEASKSRAGNGDGMATEAMQ